MINSKLKKVIISIVLAVIAVGSTIGYMDVFKKNPTSEPEHSAFVFTKDEISQLDKWKNKPLEEVSLDAFNGDAAGLYYLGISFLEVRNGQVSDPLAALAYFAASGSLGYAPAIEKIRSFYLYEKDDPFLALVYEHLLVSLGHPELLTSYHGRKQDLSKNMEKTFSKEIESLANLKKQVILHNLHMLQKIENKHDYISLFCLSGGIMENDHLLYPNYLKNGFWTA